MEDMIRLAQAGNAIVTLSKRSAGAELNIFTKELSEEMYYTQGVQQRETHLTLAHLLHEVSDQVKDGIEKTNNRTCPYLSVYRQIYCFW